MNKKEQSDRFSTKYRVSNDVVFREMPDGTLLLLKKSNFYRVDGATVDILTFSNGEHDLEEVFIKMATKHKVSKKLIQKECVPVISSLIELDILEAL